MKKLIVILPLLSLFLSCAKKEVTPEQPGECRVYNLDVDSADEKLYVRFQSDCSDLISGYNIYVRNQPIASGSSSTPYKDATPHNTTPFPGDTNPDDEWETYIADGLQNGEKYWVSVVVVYSDRSLSRPTDEVVAACGPRGEMEIGIRYTAARDGYSFIDQEYVEADELANDIYFFSQNGNDYLDSPTRLDGFLRKTRLAKLPAEGDFDAAVNYVQENKIDPSSDRIAIAQGDWVLLKTPESHLVLIQVRDLSGSGSDRRVRLFYAYSSIANQLLL